MTKRKQFSLAFSFVCFIAIMLPFYLPDSVAYKTHSNYEYNFWWNVWATINVYSLIAVFYYGAYAIGGKIFDYFSKP